MLTPRELEVLKLIAEAYTSRQIAEVLFISVETLSTATGRTSSTSLALAIA